MVIIGGQEAGSSSASRQGIIQQQHDPGQLSVTAHHQPSGPAPRTFHQATIKPQAIGALVVNSVVGSPHDHRQARRWQRCEEQASGDRQRPAVSAPLVPCRESSRWVINGFTAVEFAGGGDVDVGSPLGEFLVGHRPSRVWRFGLALIKPSPLLSWGESEVTHLHHRAYVCCCLA
jgi:hypothetical protein